MACALTFYGSSFICDHTGAKLAEAGRDEPERADRHHRSADYPPRRAGLGCIPRPPPGPVPGP